MEVCSTCYYKRKKEWKRCTKGYVSFTHRYGDWITPRSLPDTLSRCAGNFVEHGTDGWPTKQSAALKGSEIMMVWTLEDSIVGIEVCWRRPEIEDAKCVIIMKLCLSVHCDGTTTEQKSAQRWADIFHRSTFVMPRWYAFWRRIVVYSELKREGSNSPVSVLSIPTVFTLITSLTFSVFDHSSCLKYFLNYVKL